MDVVLWVIGAFIFGSVFGWVSRERHAIRKVNKMFANMEKKTEEEAKDNQIMGTIEIHHGHYYMFRVDDGSFLAQGETKKELSEALRKRFPEKVFVLAKEEYKDLGFKDVAF